MVFTCEFPLSRTWDALILSASPPKLSQQDTKWWKIANFIAPAAVVIRLINTNQHTSQVQLNEYSTELIEIITKVVSVRKHKARTNDQIEQVFTPVAKFEIQ